MVLFYSLVAWLSKHTGNVCTPGRRTETQTGAPMCCDLCTFLSLSHTLFLSPLIFISLHFSKRFTSAHTQPELLLTHWAQSSRSSYPCSIRGLYRLLIAYTRSMIFARLCKYWFLLTVIWSWLETYWFSQSWSDRGASITNNLKVLNPLRISQSVQPLLVVNANVGSH